MLNVAGNDVVLGKAMQSYVHRQHDGAGKIKYRKEFRSRYATFIIITVLYVNAIRRDVVIANVVGLL